jgi:hypothetical protein
MNPSTVGNPVTSKTTGTSKPTLPSKRKFSESSGSSYKKVGKNRMKYTEESSAEPINEDDEESKSVSEDSANMGRNVDKGRIQSSRLRSKNVEQRVDNE